MKLRDAAGRLKQKGLFYWLSAFALVVVGVIVGHWLETQDLATALRYKAYQFITQRFSPRKAYATRTAVVLVGDEFWTDPLLAHRSPIKRDYLVQLVSALDDANASAIALDFDMRWPDPGGGAVAYHDYDDETQRLLEAIRDVSKRRPVILPMTIRWDDGYY